jgi:hypothetical protein
MHRDDKLRDSGTHKAIAIGLLAHGSSASSSYSPVISEIIFCKALSSIKEIDGNNIEKLLRYAYRHDMAVSSKKITIGAGLVDALSIQGVDERAATLKDPRGLHA